MTEFLSIFSQIPVLGWVGMASALLMLAFIWWRHAHEAAFFDFLVSFPIPLFGHIGKLKRLKGNTTNLNSPSGWREGMPTQEHELCSAYYDKISGIFSEREFNNALVYLSVTGQASVRPLGFGIVAVLFVLTMGEAIGTGFFISPYVSQHITSNQAIYVAMALAFVLAITLLALTHMAGKTFFERKTFREILGQLDSEAIPEGYRHGDSMAYGTTHDQRADHGRSQAVRFFARLEKQKYRGTLSWTIGITLTLLVIMGTVFGGRYYEINEKTTLEAQTIKNEGLDGGGSAMFPGMTELPQSVMDAQAETRERAAEEVVASRFGQGMMAAILLAMFYLIVQVVGFAVSMTHAFFQNGSKAFKDTRGCTTYEEYLATYLTPFVTRAQSRLDELRARYARVNENYSHGAPIISFVEYYHLRKADHHNAPQAAQELRAREQQRVAAPAPAVETTLPPAGAAAADLHALAREIRALPDRDARQARLVGILAALDADQQTHLRSIMASMKDEDERKKLAMSQFDDLI
ncbi:MAG: hypothetical protein FNT29_09595 [Halothiobacillaceae bacterium]|nr:MAG: hypothetical protein FNT29_09595 [Halothiobacillaceae bacterium]